MSLGELLGRLHTSGVTLSVEGERLRCSAPKGSLTTELQQELANYKFEIVAYLREARHLKPLIPKADRKQPLPLSFTQQRMWFLHRLQPESPVYNITAFAGFRGEIQVSVLEASIHEVVRRHECLRTSFAEHQGAAIQIIHGHPHTPLTVIDLSDGSPEESKRRLQVLLRQQTRQPFDLSLAPLFRISLVRMSPEWQVLALTIHHIVSDGWSMGIFFGEVREIYQALASGSSPAISDPVCQFADYACWQQNESANGAFGPDLTYWKQKLEGSTGLLDLPTDFSRPTVQGFAGSVSRFALSSHVTNELRKLSQSEGASHFMVLLTVFKVLLARYTHQSDISVGTPVDIRSHPELEKLIGCFVNTLVLRTQLPATITARDLLRSVRETVLEGHAHLHSPFEKVVETLRPERSLSHSTLFQVAFNLQNTPLSSEYETLSVSSTFDLSLFMWEDADTFYGAFEYRTDLFEERTIARMANHFGVLAGGIAANPDQPIALLPLLSNEETTRLLDICTQTARDYRRDQTIHGLFETQVLRTPNAPAVIAYSSENGPPQQVTYLELESQSNRLAHRLRSLGVGSEALVGVCLDRSADMVTALLAVLKAGGAYVPMDLNLPLERLAFMMEDTRLSVVICDERFLERVPPNVVVVSLPGDWADMQQFTDLPLPNLASPENLAYVIFTSGSTGKPKGVQVTHGSVVNFLESMRRVPGLTANDRLLSVTTLSFDIAGLEIYLPLITGASVLLASRAVAADGRQLAHLLAISGATVMQATPATWQILFESGWNGQRGLKVLCGGDALPRNLADRLLSATSEVWNLYGPTETTIWSTVYRVKAGDGTVPIGRPIANTQVYLLDENRQLVPPGVSGELCIGGDGVARGYLNRPDLTARQFSPDPFVPTARLYRTGDLARWLPDGNLLFLGRLDHQVKIRGLRIELEEIEHLLRGHPDVQDAVVAAIRDDSSEMALAGYVVLRDGGGHIELNSLRRYLANHLPEYMIPATFTELKALPLTANGKVNRLALPSPVRTIEKSVRPRNLIETQLLHIWEQVLGQSGIGIRDNFFELGGHSLLAVRLFSRMEKVFGVFPISLLFQAPTVEQMAAKLSEAGSQREWRAIVAIQPKGDKPPLFVVPGVDGNILSFTNVVLGLDSNQPVYGFQVARPDGQPPPERVEDVAKHFVSEVLAIQPAGRVHLAGLCVGGAVAFEMAHQLTQLGHEVGTLVLVDTFPPGVYPPSKLTSNSKARAALAICSSAAERIGRFHKTRGAEKLAYFRKLRGILYRMVFRFETPHDFRSAVLAKVVKEINFTAISRYRPRPYHGRVVIILCDDGTVRKNDPRLEWAELAESKAEILRIAAPSHDSLFEQPWVSQIASDLGKVLQEEKYSIVGQPE